MARSDIDQTLAGIPIFSECSKKELKAISKLVTSVHINMGKVLAAIDAAGMDLGGFMADENGDRVDEEEYGEDFQ